ARADLAHLDGRPLRRRALAGDRDRLRLAGAVQEEEAAHDLLRLREGTVDDAALASAHLDANAVGVGRERVARPEHAPGFQASSESLHAVVGALALARVPAAPQVWILDDQHQVGHVDSFLRS